MAKMQMCKYVNVRMSECADVRMGKCADGQMSECADGRMGELELMLFSRGVTVLSPQKLTITKPL